MADEKPIIGILCMDVAAKLFEVYGSSVTSYISASYVKFIECAGGRVVPIWIGKDVEYYKDIMKKINGILLPGGAVFFDSKHATRPEQTNECVRSSEIIFKLACKKNDDGNYFPIWGTCLGFELLLYHSAGGKDLRQDCSKLNKPMPLELEDDFETSKMFKGVSEDLRQSLETEPFAFHFHQYCITKEDLQNFKIADQWRVTSQNKDDDGLRFISTTEHVKYPIYGVQFHPEKVIFESVLNNEAAPNMDKSIACAKFLAQFLISECRKNCNKLTPADERRYLISNFKAEETGIEDSKWSHCYLFNKTSSRYPEAEN